MMLGMGIAYLEADADEFLSPDSSVAIYVEFLILNMKM